MSFRVGVDLVETEAVREAITVHGDRYLHRVYTDAERRDSGSDPVRLAARFAAKEATMKALDRGDEPLPWRSIAVKRDASGSPSLVLEGPAAALARDRGIRSLAVSITHERAQAAAVVLAEVAP
jgi:holo-[acyl-carrier protein] synthase